MTTQPIAPPVTPLRQRMLDDMAMRAMGARTQHDYVRHVRSFAAFLKRSPDTATAEDVRRFQLHQRVGMQIPDLPARPLLEPGDKMPCQPADILGPVPQRR